MLSNDELTDGMPFILTLWNSAGAVSHWAETLRGNIAARWYEIYRTSDWEALRLEGPAVFHTRVTEDQVRTLRAYGRRCIVLHTTAVASQVMVGA
jgi:hypothetical protein